MVPLEGNAPTSFDYQSSALLLSYKGIGSSGKIRTYTVHRMKVLHYHYATLPLVAGVGFEPHDFLLMRQARTTSPLTRN